MDTDKYNPMKRETSNDFKRSSTNSEQARIAAKSPVDDEICQPEGVVNMDAAACVAANAQDPDLQTGISGSEFGSWQDSAPVMRLSAFLRANSDAGIRLCRRGDSPCLVFDPPLRRSDIGSMHWAIASHAYDLAIDATRDLAMLIRAGIITTEDIDSLDDIDAAGPSA